MTEFVSYKDRFLEFAGEFNSELPSYTDLMPYFRISDLSEAPTFSVGALLNSNKKPVRNEDQCIVICGAGGVTSWLLPGLIKILFSRGLGATIYLIDHDKVEDKNLIRQNFIPEDVGHNKAEVLAERYSNIYPNINIIAVPKYFYSSTFVQHIDGSKAEEFADSDKYIDIREVIREAPRLPTMFINCLDNELSKHMLDTYLVSCFGRSSYRRPMYFSTGCFEHGGTVTAIDLNYDLYSNYYKDETFIVEDAEIETHSCADVVEQNIVEQTFNSNDMAANLLRLCIDNYLVDTNYSAKRISFTSTGAPYVRVTAKEHAKELAALARCLSSKFYAVVSYLSDRDWEFKNSKLGREHKSFVQEWESVFDFDSFLAQFRT